MGKNNYENSRPSLTVRKGGGGMVYTHLDDIFYRVTWCDSLSPYSTVVVMYNSDDADSSSKVCADRIL